MDLKMEQLQHVYLLKTEQELRMTARPPWFYEPPKSDDMRARVHACKQRFSPRKNFLLGLLDCGQ